MNSLNLVGRLTKDPELRYTASGKAVCNFSLAVNRPYDREKSDFFRVTVWGKPGESVANYLKKGSQASVTGRIEVNQYDASDGSKKLSVDVIADRVGFLSSVTSGTNNNSENNSDGGFTPTDDIDDDDVPF